MSESNVDGSSTDLGKPGVKTYKYEDVAITRITIPPGRSSPEPEQVADLAGSIQELGQLQLIGVTADYRLIYGRRRMAAFELLGRTTIGARIFDLDDLHTELAEIDENMERRTLTVLEEAQALARRKTIYETLHPDAKPVTIKGGPGRGKKTSDNLSPVSYARDAAEKTGRSARTVQRKVEIGEKLDSEAADTLRGTKYENSQSVLKDLADRPVQKQRERAKELKAGAPPRIRRKRKSAKYRKGSYVRTHDGVFRLASREDFGQFRAVGYKGGPVTLIATSSILEPATKEDWLASLPAPNPEPLSASPADAGAGDGGAPSDTVRLTVGAAEPPVGNGATAPHPSDPVESAEQEIERKGQDNPVGLVTTDAAAVFDAMTEGWEYDRKLEILEKFFGQDAVSTMLGFVKASDLNELKQFLKTYIEERKNT